MSRRELNSVLAADSASRNLKDTPTKETKSVESGRRSLASPARKSIHTEVTNLFTLDQINFNKAWDYSLPTIQSIADPDLKTYAIRNINAFQASFNTKYSAYFSNIDFNNILIAGGSVTGTLLRKEWDNDVDIFIYGLTVEQANKKVVELIKQLYSSYRATLADEFKRGLRGENDTTEPTDAEIDAIMATQTQIVNVRNKNCITLQFGKKIRRRPNQFAKMNESVQMRVASPMMAGTVGYNPLQKIQIILRLYSSKSEILLGFDMGSCAVGYDGNNILFTELGKFSYEYLVIVVDPSRRSTTYEKRLIKYHQRGFHIVLPNLDIAKLSVKNLKYNVPEVADLPYLTFSYKSIKGNKIVLDRVLRWGNAKDDGDGVYEFEFDYQPDELDEYKVFFLNLKALVKRTGDFYYYSTHPNLDILTDPPYITAGRIIDYYDTLAKKIYHKSTFNVKTFKEYFSEELLPKVIEQLFIEKNVKYLNDLIESQKNQVLETLEDTCEPVNGVNPVVNLTWITKSPGSQLIGSFNPVVSNPKDWYGSYYTDNIPVKEERVSKCDIKKLTPLPAIIPTSVNDEPKRTSTVLRSPRTLRSGKTAEPRNTEKTIETRNSDKNVDKDEEIEDDNKDGSSDEANELIAGPIPTSAPVVASNVPMTRTSPVSRDRIKSAPKATS